jgi:hypothetical protein
MPSATEFLEAPAAEAPSASGFLDSTPANPAPKDAASFLAASDLPAPAAAAAAAAPKAADFLATPTPELDAAKKRWATAGPLERLGMLWKGFSYDKSVQQAFQPNPGQAQIPSITPTGGAAGQVGAVLDNTVSGAFNSLGAPAVAGTALTPAAALYAAPYFIKQFFKDAPDAIASYFDPDATAADRTNKTVASVMDFLGGVGTASHGLKGAREIASPIIDAKAPALANKIASAPVRARILFSRDAADNAANRQAVIASNDIAGPLGRLFGKSQVARDALSFQVEALNNPDNLAAMRQKLEASAPPTPEAIEGAAKNGTLPDPTAAADPKWKARALAAIDFAQKNFDSLRSIAEKYNDITKGQWERENAAGQETPYRAGYVLHAQDIADPAGFESSSSSGNDTSSAFKMTRTHNTFADSIAAGVDPKTLDSIDLLRKRIENGQKLVNRDAWIDQVKQLRDPTNFKSVATNVTMDTAADGTSTIKVPDGYTAEQFGNKTVAVQKGYEGLFRSISDPSALSDGGLSTVSKISQTGKALNLLVDTFHLGRLAMWQSAIKASGLSTFKAPLPSYRAGLALMDHSPEEIRSMADAGAVPKTWLPKLLQNKTTLDLLEKNGMNTGRAADAMHQEWVRKIPGVGNLNQFVFDKFQRGAVGEIGLLEFERQKGMYPELTDSQVARKVATDVNTRFGNFGRQGILKSKTMQDLARLVLLAPSWNEGLIRSELGAVKQGAAAVKDAVVNKRLASGMLARGTATMVLGQLAANQLINYFTRGHPTWKNPEEGASAKLSAWIPDKIGGSAGFFLNPTTLPAETFSVVEKSMERDPSWQKALVGYARSRLSYLGKPAWTFATRTDALGRPIRTDDLAGEVLKSANPLPIGSGAAALGAKEMATGQPSEGVPGQFEKQLFGSFGTKLSNAPDPDQRMGALARDFNRKRGVQEGPEFAASDFEPLTTALKIGNQKDAAAAMRDLLEHKTPEQVEKYFVNHAKRAYTGQGAREQQFLVTLSTEQKAAYGKARDSRYKLAEAALDLLDKHRAENPDQGEE